MHTDGVSEQGPARAAGLLEVLRDHAVLELSPEGAVLWASAGAETLFGEPAQDLAGREASQLFETGGPGALAQRLRRALSSEGGAFREQLRVIRRDGGAIWADAAAYLQPNGRIAVICQDVTAQRRRRLADERLRLLTHAVHDFAICVLSPSGLVVDWNAGAERLMGHAAQDVVGRHYSCFFTDADRGAGIPLQALEQARVAGSHEMEGWRLRADGGRFWAWMVLDLLRDEAGQPAGFALTLRDITERRVAQEALRQSEQQFRLLVNGVRDHALYMLDPNGIVVSWNSGAERIKGYRAEEIIGHHYSRFFTETDRAAGKPARSLQAAVEHGRLEFEGWRVRKDGSLFWASVVLNAIHGEGGELIGFAKITRDATERRRSEAELARTQEQLFHAQKLEALGQLTGGIAHDFNNLLMVVSGQARKLKAGAVPPELAARAAGLIEAAADRGAVLIRQLLSFARRQPLHRAAISLPERIGGFKDMLAKSLGAAARLELALPDDVWPIEADSNELEMAMINLAANARDAMPEGGVLTITAENVTLRAGDVAPDLAGEFVALRFADSGVGIPPDILAQIFDPFFTTKQADKGTGLGLSQVYGFARQCGGAVVAQSILGHGAAITLYLPRAKPQPARVEAEAGPDDHRGVALVVEDNPDVAEVTAELVQQLGYKACLAQNAEAALRACETGDAYDLVVSDVVMAGEMDGLALAGVLRARWPQMPIVMVSGYPKSANAADEALPILNKPIKLEALERAVSAARRAAAGEATPSNVVQLDAVRRPQG